MAAQLPKPMEQPSPFPSPSKFILQLRMGQVSDVPGHIQHQVRKLESSIKGTTAQLSGPIDVAAAPA
eukprot:8869757-Pyramimonas_sp.AAC.1